MTAKKKLHISQGLQPEKSLDYITQALEHIKISENIQCPWLVKKLTTLYFEKSCNCDK